jgi:hypothetical protein
MALMMARTPPRLAVACLTLLAASCAGVSNPATQAVVTAPQALSSSVAPTVDPWAQDLDLLEVTVRAHHPAPFAMHTKAEWKATLADVRPRLAAASSDQRLALVASVVGLLDTHTSLALKDGFRAYEVLFYKFSDGWFVVGAKDTSLLGARLISIDGHAVADVEASLRSLVPHDNEDGFLINAELAPSRVELLHGAGLVSDPAKPHYLIERADGTRTRVDPAAVPEPAMYDDLGVSGYLIGPTPEAVARRNELTWTRLDAKRKVFLISVNDYGDTTATVAAMTAALDAKTANRVVLDIRYLRGGNGDFKILDALKKEERVNRPGGLTVLIGRENESVATSVVWEFDVHTKALLVGEPTPARADNFTCDCYDIELPHLGIVVTIPQSVANNGDVRPAIEPDVTMRLSSSDFFASRDPVLEAALRGIQTP